MTLGVCDGGWEIGHARFQGNEKGRELQFSRVNVGMVMVVVMIMVAIYNGDSTGSGDNRGGRVT